MQPLAARSWIAAGVALAGASVIAVTPLTAPPPGVRALDVQLTSGDVDMVLDLVRHGQSEDNVSGYIGTVPPGAALTATGEQQAITVGESLYNNGDNDIDGVWASAFTRTQQTAWPLIELLAGKSDYADIPAGPAPILDPNQILPGLNELSAGVLEGTTQTQSTGLLYLVAPLAWMFGQYWVPQLGSTTDPNGMAFEDRFNDAVQTIYSAGGTVGSDGDYHDVAFSHAAAITTWVMMNVKNPDFELYFKSLEAGLLPNTGQVVVEGNPTDGWTLVSWAGTDVPQNPGLLTELFVDYRDLITAPQMASWNIYEAILGGDPTTISNAIQTGFDQVGAALLQFPQSVINDIIGEFQDVGTAVTTGGSGEMSAIIADLVGSI